MPLSPALAIALLIVLGAASQWFAWRIHIPAILPLLVVGFLVGPVLGLVHPSKLIGNDILFPAVSLAVGLVLFEGGTTLRFPEIVEIRHVVRNLITVGVAVSWLGAILAAHYLVGLDLGLSFLFGALVFVTGPTVIGPLLRIVRPIPRVANILKWEGMLIDPLGAMAAAIVFKILILDNRALALSQALLSLGKFFGVGIVLGLAGGYFLAFILRRRLLPDYLVNLVALALVFAVFALADEIEAESGLLAVVIMGMLVANQNVPRLAHVLNFKEDLAVLFISVLFVTLAANISLDSLSALNGSSLLLLVAMIVVVRPVGIFLSTLGSSLSLKEKLFLSWVAPRGIVAASVTSLFAFRLSSAGYAGAGELVPLVFLVIVGTVILDSLTAKPVARLLGVAEPDPQGFLILGAHAAARRIGAFLQGEELNVILADTNWSNVAAARSEGLSAYYGSLLSAQSDDELRLSGIGKLLALTSNDEANSLAALKYGREFSSQNAYQLESNRAGGTERMSVGEQRRGRPIFYTGTSYAELTSLFGRGGELKKEPITEASDLEDFLEEFEATQAYLPMFVIKGKQVTPVSGESLTLEPGNALVSLVLSQTDARVATRAS
jgi:NhaP-type Na+/H+ or K+/H+ antiporter